MIRYGILGFGHHGRRRLIPGFAGAKEARLAGIWRRNIEKAESDANEFGIEHAFSSAEELCSSPAIDAVFVTSPDAFHMRDTLLAFRHNKPVLCEKPLAMDAEEVRQMLAASQKANLLFGVAQNFRYNRSVNLIRDWVQAGRVGKPIFASAHFYFQAGHSPRAWIYDPSLARGGVMGDVGIHCIDALRFILQDDVSAVTTIAASDVHSKDIDSNAVLTLDFARGAIGSMMVSFRSAYRTLLEVVGEDGIVRCESGLTVDFPVDVLLLQGGKIIESQQVSNTDGYSRMLDGFSAAIEGHGSYAATGEDGLRNQLALDAGYASWRSGRKEIVSGSR